MRFAIAIPQVVTDGSFDPAAMRTYLAEAEEFGFESAWTGEQVLGTLPVLSPLEVLSYAAAYTQWIRLGCAMLVSPLHNPVHLAKTIATVDQLSRGRLDVGLVTGGPFRMFSADLPHRASSKQSHDGVPGKHGTLGQRHAGNGSHAVAGVAILSAVSPTLAYRRPGVGAPRYCRSSDNDLLAGAKNAARGRGIGRYTDLYHRVVICYIAA
jgi:hypothetical protein